MPSVDISAQHSKEERPYFGLDRILDDLLKDPLREHVIVARVVRSGLTVNDEKGTSRPRIRPLHIEVMVDGVRKKAALELLDAEYRDRTGRDAMPPGDLFNLGPGDGQLEGQTTVEEHLDETAEGEQGKSAEEDPTAGPHFSDQSGELWPGDAGYEAKS